MDYMCNEKIILSAIAFLELPKVILELHKRMPPVLKSEFPPKRKIKLKQSKLSYYPVQIKALVNLFSEAT